MKELAVGERLDRGRAGAVVDERHLPEKAAFAKLPHIVALARQLVRLEDAHRARKDHVESPAELSLDDHVGVRFVGRALAQLDDRGELLVSEGPEELHLSKKGDRGSDDVLYHP